MEEESLRDILKKSLDSCVKTDVTLDSLGINVSDFKQDAYNQMVGELQDNASKKLDEV